MEENDVEEESDVTINLYFALSCLWCVCVLSLLLVAMNELLNTTQRTR